MDFKNIDNKYRFTPIWSWNEKLNISETKRQIELLKQSGMGGFIIHARDGIKSAYMGDEFFRNITQSINDADSSGMNCWICDENGFPSGSGGGIVNSKGLDYQQKFLRMEAGEKTNDRTIICKDGYHFYYDVNPSYIDTLNPDTVRCFIEEAYEKYFEKTQNSFEGFYIYEPQFVNDAIPWSFTLPAEYKKEYNEELLDKLEELFRPIGDYENTRIKFWILVTKLFSNNYTKQIFDWCNEHSVKLSGHFAQGDSPCFSGAVMPNYKYLHTPGIKSSYKNSSNPLAVLQASSVAHQFGKKEVWAELYSQCNNSMSIGDFKRTAEFQMVRGITKICPHTAPYSLRGFRKENCQPAFFYQQPWWEDIKLLSDSLSRIGMILSEGKVKFDTLLISNNTSMWSEFDDSDALNEHSVSLLDAVKTLEKKHIPFHIGDEVIISQNARVENGAFVIGTQRYTNVVLPKHKTLLLSTESLLSEFERVGGNIVLAETLEANDVCDKEELTYTERHFDEFTAHYFVNSTDKEFVSAINRGSKMLDITTGEVVPFYGVYKFHPYESLVVFDDGSPMQSRPFKKQLKELDISGEWQIKECSENALAIDVCDLYFDGELASEKENARDIIYKANNLNRDVNIRCDYHFNIKFVPENIYLACETPEIFGITVNGTELNPEDLGYYLYPALRKLEIKDLLIEGENVISLNLDFSPTLKSGENLEQFSINELQAEFEPIYIVGDFSVCTDGKFLKLDKNACRYVGDFSIEQAKETIDTTNIEKQGFPFFSGKMTLSKKFNISDTGYMINLSRKGISSLTVSVNQNTITPSLLEPCEVNLSDHLQKGDNEIEITISNSLRNLLGPHHLPTGENLSVTPAHFHKEPCVWNNNTPTPWEENYCFIEFGFDNFTPNE